MIRWAKISSRPASLINSVSTAPFSAALKDLNARQDKYVINFVYDELEDFKVTKNIKNESVPDWVFIYLKSVQIKDIPEQCYLGEDNNSCL